MLQGKDGLDRVQRRCADVAEDDAQSCQRQSEETSLALWGVGSWGWLLLDGGVLDGIRRLLWCRRICLGCSHNFALTFVVHQTSMRPNPVSEKSGSVTHRGFRVS